MIPVGFGYGEQSMSDPFQPFVSRAPNGFAGGIGNPMQDAFQRFLSAQGQSAGGIPPTPRDPFRRSDEGIPLSMQLGGDTGMPPMGRDPFRRSDEGIPLWMQLGQPNPNQSVGFAGGVGTPAMGDYSMYAPEYRPGSQPMDRQRQPGQVYSPEIQAYYAQDAADQAERSRRLQMLQGVQGAGQGESPMGVPPVGFAGGGTGMPPIGEPIGGRRPYGVSVSGPYNTDPSRPQGQQAQQNPTGAPPMQPMTQPPMGGLSYNDGFYNPANRTQQPMTQAPAPMAMKKGGFAVKAVWDKKRPKDLGKPKDLSAKKEKSAKARAKAAGRPYPNLIDNMAAARKKGK